MMVNFCKKHKKTAFLKGFTLIELINVIVIIGILAAIAVPRFLNFRDQATLARDQGVLAALRSAIYLYYVQSAAQCNASSSCDAFYPPNTTVLVGLVHWDPPDLACQYNWTLTDGSLAKPTFCP
jgi:prepilin-type N-terminal cleavage/methylation domain-containing protein